MRRKLGWVAIACAALLACNRREVPPEPASRPPPVPVQPARSAGTAGGHVDPAAVERIAPQAAHARVQAGQALLVCAYDDARCAHFGLEGSIPYSALEDRLPQLPRDQEIILFCD